MTLEKSPVRTPTTVERKQTLIHRGLKVFIPPYICELWLEHFRRFINSTGVAMSRGCRCAQPRVLRVMRGGPEDCEIASQVWRCGAPLFLM